MNEQISIFSLQVSDPLEQALKFLRPLQDLASDRIETHLLAYEVSIRKSMLLHNMYLLTEWEVRTGQGPVSRMFRKVFGLEEPFQKTRSFLCTELIMSTGSAFKQSLHLCNVSHLRFFLVFQLRACKVGFSGPRTFLGFRETGARSMRPDRQPDFFPSGPTSLRQYAFYHMSISVLICWQQNKFALFFWRCTYSGQQSSQFFCMGASAGL